MKKQIAFLAAACVLSFTACNKGKETKEDEHAGHDHAAHANTDEAVEEPVAESTETVVESTDAVASADNTVAELTISGGDDMKYDKSTLKVTAGQKVKLTLKHTGKLPKVSMGHNLVILKNGVNDADFAASAIGAKDNDYFPVGGEKDVIAHTKMLGGGESVTIEFTAPARGAYTFICTFPGHAALMKGKLMVQ